MHATVQRPLVTDINKDLRLVKVNFLFYFLLLCWWTDQRTDVTKHTQWIKSLCNIYHQSTVHKILEWVIYGFITVQLL